MDVAFLRDRERTAKAEAKRLSEKVEQKIVDARRRCADLLYDKVEGKKKRKAACWADPAEVQEEEFRRWHERHLESQHVLITHGKVLDTLKSAQEYVTKTDKAIQDFLDRNHRLQMNSAPRRWSCKIKKAISKLDSINTLGYSTISDDDKTGEEWKEKKNSGPSSPESKNGGPLPKRLKSKTVRKKNERESPKNSSTTGCVAELSVEIPSGPPDPRATVTDPRATVTDPRATVTLPPLPGQLTQSPSKGGSSPNRLSGFFAPKLKRSKFSTAELEAGLETMCLETGLSRSSLFKSTCTSKSCPSLPSLHPPHMNGYSRERDRKDLQRRDLLEIKMNAQRVKVLQHCANLREIKREKAKVKSRKWSEKKDAMKKQKEAVVEHLQECVLSKMHSKQGSVEEKKNSLKRSVSAIIQNKRGEAKARVEETLVRKQAVLDFKHIVKTLSMSIAKSRENQFHDEQKAERQAKIRQQKEQLAARAEKFSERRLVISSAKQGVQEASMSQAEKTSKSSLEDQTAFKHKLKLNELAKAKKERLRSKKRFEKTFSILKEDAVAAETDLVKLAKERIPEPSLKEVPAAEPRKLSWQLIQDILMKASKSDDDFDDPDEGDAFGAMVEQYLKHGVIDKVVYEQQCEQGPGAREMEYFEDLVRSQLKQAKMKPRNKRLISKYFVETTTSFPDIIDVNVDDWT